MHMNLCFGRDPGNANVHVHVSPSAELNWLLRLEASDVCSVCTFITDIIYVM